MDKKTGAVAAALVLGGLGAWVVTRDAGDDFERHIISVQAREIRADREMYAVAWGDVAIHVMALQPGNHLASGQPNVEMYPDEEKAIARVLEVLDAATTEKRTYPANRVNGLPEAVWCELFPEEEICAEHAEESEI